MGLKSTRFGVICGRHSDAESRRKRNGRRVRALSPGASSLADLIAPATTAMIITFNEAPNLARCLDRLSWAARILIVDSGSTDATLAIARAYPRVDVVERAFDDFASQCNFGLTKIATPWVLSLDADYALSEALEGEMGSLREGAAQGYAAAFVYRINGRALRGALYPPRTILYRVRGAAYRNEGHGHRVEIPGPVARLAGKIYHDDRKPLATWFDSQKRYARREADYLLSTQLSELGRADRLRRLGWPAPPLVFLYALLAKGCILDGWPGWFYVLQRTAAEILIALELADRRLRREP